MFPAGADNQSTILFYAFMKRVWSFAHINNFDNLSTSETHAQQESSSDLSTMSKVLRRTDSFTVQNTVGSSTMSNVQEFTLLEYCEEVIRLPYIVSSTSSRGHGTTENRW
jgi:hypothetical protein